ncbi:polysaccharide pyruvyl transferase WcaK-like protein [Prauserella shujinwangii]|uniref:Polysaccharide pyruvyl transferase WcaK-like protein n=1 Tax=Prauserella shujinwangii TaxID=1453103 RepID=A0A2T0LVR7_9PSEU|nr:polysaccharide pyruvyl transferase family protein [Prauserella shujinwangii]PRX47943.1 polysaccharide pyruvyl transferase WcaK-like protein [Prauserella shujinwangii]
MTHPGSDGRRLYYLVATAGCPNYGDELIAAGWLRQLARTDPEADVWVDTQAPGPAAVLLGGEHPRVRFTDTLWRLCWEAPSDEPWRVSAWVQDAVHHPGLAPRWIHGIELLRRADVVHVIGGGYVSGVWPRHTGLLAGVVAAARLSGARTAMTGQGLCPVADGAAELLRALAARFDVVDVRDEPTAELLGVPASVDDAFLVIGPELYSDHLGDDRDVPEVMVCLQSDLAEVGTQRVASATLAMLRRWQVPPDRVCFAECIPRVDREVYTLLEPELPGARFLPFVDVWRSGLPVSPLQTWISTRFHPHLVAAAGGAPGVAMSVRPDFYDTKHRSLIEQGSGWTLLDVTDGTVPERPGTGGFDEGALEKFQRAKLRLAEEIYAPRD